MISQRYCQYCRRALGGSALEICTNRLCHANKVYALSVLARRDGLVPAALAAAQLQVENPDQLTENARIAPGDMPTFRGFHYVSKPNPAPKFRTGDGIRVRRLATWRGKPHFVAGKVGCVMDSACSELESLAGSETRRPIYMISAVQGGSWLVVEEDLAFVWQATMRARVSWAAKGIGGGVSRVAGGVVTIGGRGKRQRWWWVSSPDMSDSVLVLESDFEPVR